MSWFSLFHPVVLFGLGAFQAIFPYILWMFGYPRLESYQVEISYEPVLLWFLALGAFVFGSFYEEAIREKRVSASFFANDFNRIDLVRVTLLGYVLLPLVVFQLFLIAGLYGEIPIVGFATGLDIDSVNLQQSQSGLGQLGLLQISIATLGAILFATLAAPNNWSLANKILAICIILILVIATTFQGKRQGLAMEVMSFVFACIATGSHPANRLFEKLGLRRLGFVGTCSLISIGVVILVILMGTLGSLRLGEGLGFSFFGGVDELIRYLSLPLINMEWMLSVTEWRDNAFDPAALLVSLLPYKIWEGILEGLSGYELWAKFLGGLLGEPMPRIEPTASAGFFGAVYWYTGKFGIVLFCGAVGAVSKRFYLRSRSDLFSMLVYSQFCWTLFAAHTYNHFLNLIFIPVPVLCFYLLRNAVVR